MSARIPPLHLIYAFEAVVRHSSFSKAADELNVTRSTISHRIQTLEKLLNTILFERTTRKLNLSATGASYYLAVKEALLSLDNLNKINSHNRYKKTITISSPPTFANIYLLPRLKDFLDQHPDIEIAIEIAKSQLDYEISKVDFDIRYGSGVYLGMQSRQISRDTIFPVASPYYVKSKNIRQPRDLENCDFLRSYLEPWTSWFTQAHLDWKEPTQGHRFEDLSLLYHAAQNSWGVALARESLVNKQINQGTLVQLFDITAKPHFQYYAIIDPRKNLSDEAVMFIEWLCRT